MTSLVGPAPVAPGFTLTQRLKSRQALAVLPTVKPIRPVEKKLAFNDPEWIFELKHDGFRALAYIENRECRLVSRNGYSFPHWPGLKRWLGENLSEAVLDGELVCLDEHGRSQFYDLFFRRKEPIYLCLRPPVVERRGPP
ncbi:MAG TPA: hypothetical protein VLK65_02785 [Vicinamibacteria bacterium]|nr:hypothetical protein [Vicinamibacteria bacterium]